MWHMNLAHRLPWYQDCTIITIEPTECSRPICGIPVQISLTGPGIGEGCQGWMGAMKAHFSCTGRLTRISGVLCVAAAFLYASAGGSAQSHNQGASQSQTQTPPGAGKTGVPFSAPGGTQNVRQSGSNSRIRRQSNRKLGSQNPLNVTLPIAFPLSTSAWALFRFSTLMGLNVSVCVERS